MVQSLAELLSRAAGAFSADEGVLALTRDTCNQLDVPLLDRAEVSEAVRYAGPASAEAYGWRFTSWSDWTTLRAEGMPTVRLALLPIIDPKRCPLVEGIGNEAKAFAAWHQLTGKAYHGTPGMAGLSVLKHTVRTGKGKTPPAWKPAVVGPDEAYEADYYPDHWRGDESAPWMHGHDLNRAYVAAAMGVEVSPWALRHTGRIAFDARRAGWWQVELAPWNDPRIPDPAGYEIDYDRADPGDRQLVRWVTTPTLALLESLTEQGLYGGARILDSWTGPAVRGVLRGWAETMRDAYAAPLADTLPGDVAAAVRLTVKMAGRETLGLLARAENWAYRPDWWYAVVAQARCNLWRKLWTIGTSEGRWPALIDVDNVWYGADTGVWADQVPALFKVDASGLKLGAVKQKGPRRNRRPRTMRGCEDA